MKIGSRVKVTPDLPARVMPQLTWVGQEAALYTFEYQS